MHTFVWHLTHLGKVRVAISLLWGQHSRWMHWLSHVFTLPVQCATPPARVARGLGELLSERLYSLTKLLFISIPYTLISIWEYQHLPFAIYNWKRAPHCFYLCVFHDQRRFLFSMSFVTSCVSVFLSFFCYLYKLKINQSVLYELFIYFAHFFIWSKKCLLNYYGAGSDTGSLHSTELPSLGSQSSAGHTINK